MGALGTSQSIRCRVSTNAHPLYKHKLANVRATPKVHTQRGRAVGSVFCHHWDNSEVLEKESSNLTPRRNPHEINTDKMRFFKASFKVSHKGNGL